MSNQPVIFNIQYTPFKLNRNASDIDIVEHRSAREFYDMSGGNTVYKIQSGLGIVADVNKHTKDGKDYLEIKVGPS